MSDVNTVTIVGRLVAKPELKYSASGNAIGSFRIANNIFIPGRDGKENKTKVNFFSVTCFGKRAESCEKHLDKGSMVIITGRLDFQEWATKDNQKRSTVKIVANQVQFIGGGKKFDKRGAEPQAEEGFEPEPEAGPQE